MSNSQWGFLSVCQNSRLSSASNNNVNVPDAISRKGVVGQLGIVGVVFKSGDESIRSDGVGPDHGRVANIYANFKD